MRVKLAVVIAVAVGLMAAVVPVWAHHSFAAEYDANKPVKLKGTVTKVEWINPHTWIHLAVKQPDGTVVNWMFEAGSPNTLIRRGVHKNALPVGTELLIEGYQARNGSNKVNGRDVTYPDGRRLVLGSSGTGAPYDEKSDAK